MTDKTTAPPDCEALPAPSFPLSPFEFDLTVAADLGAKALGVEIVTLETGGRQGLPAKIMVGLRRGENPGFEDLSRLVEPYRLYPERKSGQATMQTFASFLALTNRHKTDDSAIFADLDWKKPSVVTVVDYHQNSAAGIARFGRHRIRYAYPLSDEWQKWVAKDGEMMEQAEFAWFLEDRIPELAAPTEAERIWMEREFATTVATPAQVVELSRGLQVNVDTKVKASNTLQSGEGQIAWEETHNGADGKPLKVPGIFLLNIAPFFMGEKVRIPVRLRYRPAGGKIRWFYQIYRPDLAITEHVRETLVEAAEKTGLPVYDGAPEMSGS